MKLHWSWSVRDKVELCERKCKDVVDEFIRLGLEEIRGKCLSITALPDEILKNEMELESAFGDREKDLQFIKNNWDIACDVYDYLKQELGIIINPFEDEGKAALSVIETKIEERLLESYFIMGMWSDDEMEFDNETIDLILSELEINTDKEIEQDYER